MRKARKACLRLRRRQSRIKQNRHPRKASVGERWYAFSATGQSRLASRNWSIAINQPQPIHRTNRSESVEVGSEGFQLAAEVGVATVDQGDALHVGRPLGGERRNQVAETAALRAILYLKVVFMICGER